MYSEILIIAAAIFKAVADTVADHFFVSIFKSKNRKFWDKTTSSVFAKRIYGYKVDAWHLANSGMIVCFISAAAVNDCKCWWFFIILSGIIFNLVFNLFYNKILR